MSDLTWEIAAWRVKDFADGWSLHATLAEAERTADGTGAVIQALYALTTPANHVLNTLEGG